MAEGKAFWPLHLQETLSNLPDQPGVYIMHNDDGEVIYVGKATSLRQRVRSYFQNPQGLTPKTVVLVSKVAWIETVILSSPREALILECNLIKQYRPHYNISLKDDKHYPYLKLTLTEEYPRLLVARETKNDGNKYYGPYVSSVSMKHIMQMLRSLFPLRSCNCVQLQKRGRACLNHHLGHCLAPCEGKISKESYAYLVSQVDLFLQGKVKGLIQVLEKEMKQASEEMHYEKAAILRDRIRAVREIQAQQQLDRSSQGENEDFVSIVSEDELCAVQVFFVRQGKVVGREHFYLSNTVGEDNSFVLQRFLLEYYSGSQNVPPHINLNCLPEDKDLIEEVLLGEQGHKIYLNLPQRGDKKRLVDLAEKNCRLILEQKLKSKERQRQNSVLGIEELKTALALPTPPYRMECYDISHIQGAYTVASMVVFINGVAESKLYRHFRIKTVVGIDDFASLAETLTRRFTRGLEERKNKVEKMDFGIFPDLLIIDGGKGQLSAVCTVLAQLGVADLPIISLAKEREEIFFPQQSEPLQLAYDNPGLQLLQRIRDEAHRFAITYHRNLRGKGQVHSVLEEIPGIGPARRKQLFNAFGDLEGIQKASLDQLQLVPTMTKTAAETVYNFLQQQAAEKQALDRENK